MYNRYSPYLFMAPGLLLLSVFFASNIASKQEHADQEGGKQKKDDWHAIRLEYDLSQQQLKYQDKFANDAEL